MIETLLIYYKTCILQHTGLLAAYKILQHLATRLQFLIISLKVITSTLQHQSVYCRGAPRWSFASSPAPGRNHGSRALKKKQRVDRLVIFPALGQIWKNPKGAKFPSAPRLWNFSFMMDPLIRYSQQCDMWIHVTCFIMFVMSHLLTGLLQGSPRRERQESPKMSIPSFGPIVP